MTTFGNERPVRHRGTLLAERYRLVTRIASGATAEVWEATDEASSRRVAVKLLHDHLTDTAVATRFRREGVEAARLRHPRIVAVHDTITEPGVEAIVMELVDGTSLRERLDCGGPLDVDPALSIALDVADALGHAHRLGLVHRDVKPGNILLCVDGTAKVTDFGIARSSDSGDLTMPGTFLGTAKYLAPEQVEGTPADARADIYALGTTLYEMLSGRVPFDGPNDAAIALNRLHTTPPPVDVVRPGIPASLGDVLQRSLARRPDDRYTDMSSFSVALRAATASDHTREMTVVRHRPPVEQAPERARRRWLATMVCLTVVAVSLVVAALLLERSDGGDLIRRAREVIGAVVQLDRDGGGAVRPVDNPLTPVGAPR